MTILRPLLPLLMLIPIIAISGMARAATPLPVQPSPTRPVTAIRPAARGSAARMVTVSPQPCIRTGSRMIC